jgi:hypothetical protein
MKNIKCLGFICFMLFLPFLYVGCDEEDIPLEKINYQGISSTKAVIVLDNRLSEGKYTHRIYVTLYDVNSSGDIRLIDSLGNATLSFNKGEMMYGTIDGIECFFPKNLSFRLIPDSVYHITIHDNTGTYDSYVKVPPSFENLIVRDTIDISKGIDLYWSNTLPTDKVYAFVEVFNPTYWSDEIILINDVIAHNDRIVVANSISPFINGWFGRVELSRKQYGMCSLSLQKKSSITARCSYLKQFVVQKK